MNAYGDSLWSHEIPVQTSELIVTSDGIGLLLCNFVYVVSNLTLIRFAAITYCVL